MSGLSKTFASDSVKNLSDKSRAAATPKSNQPSPSVSTKTLKVTSLANQSAKPALPCATASGEKKNINSAKPAPQTTTSMVSASSKTVGSNSVKNIADKSKPFGATSNVTTPKSHL